MNASKTFKTLALAGAATLSLAAGAGQAHDGFMRVNQWQYGDGPRHYQRFGEVNEHQARLDARQDRQLERILEGMERGRLTGPEAAGLLREHLAIAALERQFIADGRLGPREVAMLEQRLDHARRHIVFEQHDDERRHR